LLLLSVVAAATEKKFIEQSEDPRFFQ